MPTRFRLVLSWLALLAASALSGGTMVAMAAYLYLAPLLPEAETYRYVQLETPLRVYTSDGQLIDEIGNRRDPVMYDDIPQHLIHALIATEDVRFYSHPGVDIQSLMRGFYGFMTGQGLGGGSTITMQLANNLSFDSDNVYLRKFKEIPFALQIQRELSKEEILTLYLNTIYFGAGADGIGAAASVYYGKEVSELTVAEAAMMVALLPCPSSCNPLANPERAISRRETRLQNMLKENMITRAKFDEANAAPVTAIRRNRNIEVPAPYVAEMVRRTLFEQFQEETYTRGFEVITSIDGDKQLAANRALINGLENYYDKPHGYRGPNANYPPAAGDPTSEWLEHLAPVPGYGNQQPAIVTSLRERAFSALLKDGTEIDVPWDGIRWAYAFRSRNEAWPPPQVAGDTVQVGDLIRVKRGPDHWELGQVPDIQGALVSISPNNGRVLALVGGYDFRWNQVNRVLTPRPPGSNFKPFVYGAALEAGFSASSTINDAPFARGDYRPNNYENNFLGPITLRHALKESRNIPTVRLFDELGSETVLSFANRLGIQTQDFPRNDLTVALGSADVQPLEMVTAYATLANGGFKVNPWFIDQISTEADGVLYRARPAIVCPDCGELIAEAEQPVNAAARVLDDRVAFIMNSMLRSVVEEGSGNRVQRELQRSDLMGKTGTTNGPQELWFSGFNGNIATTVFVGFDQPQPLGEREQGATVAVPIWIDFMREALAGTPAVTMNRPNGIVDRLVDMRTGVPATPGAANSMFEYFREELAPQPAATGLPGTDIDREDGEEISTEIIF